MIHRNSILLLTVAITITVIFGTDPTSASKGNYVGLYTRLNSSDGCGLNSDRKYDRTQILEQFSEILSGALPESAKPYGKHIIKDGRPIGFSVWDITDPTNLDVAFLGECVDFIDGHIYHFVDSRLPYSFSYVAILQNGKVETFRSLNCPEGADDFKRLLERSNEILKPKEGKEEISERIQNFSRYQYLSPQDIDYFICKEKAIPRPNPDEKYNRSLLYSELGMVLYRFAPESYRRTLGVSVIKQALGNARALNFFVVDLSDPSNQQTTSLQYVDFIEGHIYHFGYLDASYSYSHIGVLENGGLKIFSGINCNNANDKLNDVVNYVKNKLVADPKRKDIIMRLKNYRKYGVYLSNSPDTAVRCNELPDSKDDGVGPS